MKTSTQSSCLLIWGLVATLLSQNVLSSTLEDQKNFFFPPLPIINLSPPVSLTPPIDPSTPPIGYGSPPPAQGSTGSPPPVHHTPPSHGGGGGGHHHGGSPPTNCEIPPPPKHVDPSPGGHHNPSPDGHHNPSPGGHHNPSPSVPTYHYSPPPSGGGGGGVGGSPPTTPTYPPIVLPPTTPGLPFPSPPFDPNSPPITGGPCDFWRNHPGFIWSLFGWYGTTIGSAFGVGTLPVIGAGTNLNLLQALSNTRTDGIGALYREGTASLLNSLVNKHFPYTTSHVRTSFLAAIGSNKAAAAQARVFKLANEGHMKLRV
ncbi:uncharacterized protein [Rutidosis leptorrhynchoides]|uniref:uncharacterized protein n=1 Tax=Rutidosis leptorrhynchoides TaxID=125765 RepID=UPI003A99F06A